ncbi:MAG: hypothetical protein KatS3mg102_2982 [Planctomycetota bacterium]|nr:MAG: hypothetical protein KatS3mg102_2982 [Planctomycetota bacterium]
MELVEVVLQSRRGEGTLATHVVLGGRSAAAEALWASCDRPGMRVRLRAGEVEDEVGLASVPGAPFELLLERASPLGDAVEALEPGAPLLCSPAFGHGMPLGQFEGHDLYLIGHGAGLGPVRGVALAALAERQRWRSVHVMCEAHFLRELPYRSEYPAWQRMGARVYQLFQRPDMGKWRGSEAAYIYEELRDLGPDPERSAVFAAGPPELLAGVAGVMRALEHEPRKLVLFERTTIAPERAREPERPAELLEKISLEGIWGSGHQCDVPDHPPVHSTPAEQPRPLGMPRYKEAAKRLAAGEPLPLPGGAH